MKSIQLNTPRAQIVMVATAIFLSLAALASVGIMIFQMSTVNSTLRDVQANMATKQSPENFEASLVTALNKLASDRAAKETKEKLDKYAAAAESTPKGKHVYGAVDARFTLVEFSDLECPFCKRFHDTPKQLTDASKGNVNWQWMHLPLDFHNPAAKVQAHAAECLAEQKGNRAFWAFLDDVFVQSRGNGQGVTDLTGMATSLGAEEGAFRDCMREGRFNSKIEEHVQKARQHGINGTPATFVVDNQTGDMQLISGAQPMQAFMAAIAKLKAEGDEKAGAGSKDGAASTPATGDSKPL